jgi:hypothetical protein
MLDAEAGEPLAQHWLRYWAPQICQHAGTQPKQRDAIRTARTESMHLTTERKTWQALRSVAS